MQLTSFGVSVDVIACESPFSCVLFFFFCFSSPFLLLSPLRNKAHNNNKKQRCVFVCLFVFRVKISAFSDIYTCLFNYLFIQSNRNTQQLLLLLFLFFLPRLLIIEQPLFFLFGVHPSYRTAKTHSKLFQLDIACICKNRNRNQPPVLLLSVTLALLFFCFFFPLDNTR